LSSEQAKQLVGYFAQDKDNLRKATEKLMLTVEALSELVNKCRIKESDGNWRKFAEETFFEDAAPDFRHLITMLAAQSQSLPKMLHWRPFPPIVEPGQLANQNHNGEEAEVQQGVLSKLASVPKRVASVTARFLAPPLLEELTSEEMQYGVNSLQAEFTRYQVMVDGGWLSAKKCRQELAEKVGQLIGWIHSDTFGKMIEQTIEIDRISAGVLKEM